MRKRVRRSHALDLRQVAATATARSGAWTALGQIGTLMSVLYFASVGGTSPVALLAAGSAVVALLNTFSTAGVEFILPAVEAGDIRRLYGRGIRALVLTLTVTSVGGGPVAAALGQPFWLGGVTAIGVLALSVGQLFVSSAVRLRRLVLIGQYRFALSVGAAATQFTLVGTTGLRPWTLFLGYALGSLAISLVFAAVVARECREMLVSANDTAQGIGWPVHMHAAAASLCNVAALQGPAALWPSALGVDLAGSWSLVTRITTAPTMLATGPVAAAVNGELAELVRRRNFAWLSATLAKWRRRLLAYAILTAIITSVAILLLPSVLGSQWDSVRELLPFALLLAIPQAVVSPTAQILNLIAASRLQLVWDLCRLGAVAVIVISLRHGVMLLAGYAGVMAISYLVLSRLTRDRVQGASSRLDVASPDGAPFC